MDKNEQAAGGWSPRRGGAQRVVQALCITLSLLCGVRYAYAEGPVRTFDLPAQSLPRAVLEFYRQSGVQAIYAATPRVLKLRTHAVHGVMASSAALSLMLRGTGLTFTFDSDHSVIIRPMRGKPPVPGVAHRTFERSAGPAVRRRSPMGHQMLAMLQPVDVTGSLIRGVRSAIAPVTTIRRTQLEQVDYPSVQDALYALPLVSLNGPREDLGIDNNVQYGAGINLRGLGVGATLVLVDGRRQPLGGLTGEFVDVSTIPWVAVKRIDVLPYGASALYGADAVAGVVNIIMRNDFSGAESLARYGSAIDGRSEWMFGQLFGMHWHGGHGMIAYEYTDARPLAASARAYAANADKTPFGGANYDSYYADPGNILNPATLQPAYGIPAGQNGNALTVGALDTHINLQNQFSDYQIFPDRIAHELYGSATQRVGSSVALFFQARYAERDTLRSSLPDSSVLQVPASNPYYVNPFPSVPYTLVAYSFLNDLGPTWFASLSRVYDGTLGATLRLGRGWQMTVSESGGKQYLLSDEYGVSDPARLAAVLADSNPATAFDPFNGGSSGNPTVTLIGQDFRRRSTSSVESSNLVANGPLIRLPAGEAKLAVGLQWRIETLALQIPQPSNLLAPLVSQRYARRIVSAYSQLHVPLLGNARPGDGPARLVLDLAGRYDHYSDFGGTFNPTARLEGTPWKWLKLRASWGRSYRAPTLDDLYDTSQNVSGMANVPDPQSPTGNSLVLVEQGSNPYLRNETASTWTAGLSLLPWRGTHLSLTYYAIDYWNRVEQPAAGDPLAILQDGREWAPVITRSPTATQIAAICNSPQYLGPIESCLSSHPAAIIDLRLANLSAIRSRGLDFEASQRFASRWGHFHFGVQGNDVLTFEQSVSPESAPVSILNTVGNPLSMRLRGMAGWSAHAAGVPGWAVDLAVNYTGAYRNPNSTLVPTVRAWTTFDLSASDRLHAGRFGRTVIRFNAVNVFNRSPPFVDNQFGYDEYNVQPLGRVLSVQVSQRW